MANEREVRARDRESLLGGWFGGFVHGEERYYASVYGVPGEAAPWGLRFDGHHVSLDWTVPRAGAVSVTPLFLGGEPREVPADHERAGLRALAEEEDRGDALWSALRPEQRAAAQIEFQPASGIAAMNRPLFLGEGPQVARGEPRGIARADLDSAQQAALDALVATYYANFSDAIAAERSAAIDAAGRDAIHFAWAGGLRPGEPGYYRVQGPTFLIEFDNTAPAADHVHAILREFDGDFGRDLLADHYAREHSRVFARSSDFRPWWSPSRSARSRSSTNRCPTIAAFGDRAIRDHSLRGEPDSTGAPASTQSRKPPSSATALAKPIWRSVAAASVEILPNSQ